MKSFTEVYNRVTQEVHTSKVDIRHQTILHVARQLTPILDYFDNTYCQSVLDDLLQVDDMRPLINELLRTSASNHPGLILLKLRQSNLDQDQVKILNDKERLKSALLTGGDSIYAQLRLRSVLTDENEEDNQALTLLNSGTVGKMLVALAMSKDASGVTADHIIESSVGKLKRDHEGTLVLETNKNVNDNLRTLTSFKFWGMIAKSGTRHNKENFLKGPSENISGTKNLSFDKHTGTGYYQYVSGLQPVHLWDIWRHSLLYSVQVLVEKVMTKSSFSRLAPVESNQEILVKIANLITKQNREFQQLMDKPVRIFSDIDTQEENQLLQDIDLEESKDEVMPQLDDAPVEDLDAVPLDLESELGEDPQRSAFDFIDPVAAQPNQPANESVVRRQPKIVTEEMRTAQGLNDTIVDPEDSDVLYKRTYGYKTDYPLNDTKRTKYEKDIFIQAKVQDTLNAIQQLNDQLFPAGSPFVQPLPETDEQQ